MLKQMICTIPALELAEGATIVLLEENGACDNLVCRLSRSARAALGRRTADTSYRRSLHGATRGLRRPTHEELWLARAHFLGETSLALPISKNSQSPNSGRVIRHDDRDSSRGY